MKFQGRKITWIVGLVVVVGVLIFHGEVILFGVSGIADALIYGFPSSQDRADRMEVYHAIAACHTFERSGLMKSAGEPPVYCNPGSRGLVTRPIWVNIYYVPNKDGQDKIIRELDKLRKAKQMKPIEVNFYAEENWKVSGPLINTPHGTFPASAERGPERAIRKVTIK